MGAILKLTNMMFTPIGLVVTVAVVVGIYYFAQWLMKD
ncbi:hypothetical protein NURINAE_01326 [Candidatus Nitrosacidococcus sp. I8]|nr:hypothetical protein NURINAE_01326 [Candidatus Nitrosacidococcus sp. I8]